MSTVAKAGLAASYGLAEAQPSKMLMHSEVGLLETDWLMGAVADFLLGGGAGRKGRVPGGLTRKDLSLPCLSLRSASWLPGGAQLSPVAGPSTMQFLHHACRAWMQTS